MLQLYNSSHYIKTNLLGLSTGKHLFKSVHFGWIPPLSSVLIAIFRQFMTFWREHWKSFLRWTFQEKDVSKSTWVRGLALYLAAGNQCDLSRSELFPPSPPVFPSSVPEVVADTITGVSSSRDLSGDSSPQSSRDYKCYLAWDLMGAQKLAFEIRVMLYLHGGGLNLDYLTPSLRRTWAWLSDLFLFQLYFIHVVIQ